MKHTPTINMILIGLFAAVIAVVSQISIPLPTGVPITLQTFIIPLCGFVLGWKLGTFSFVIYLFIGLMGAPVFANFRGGVEVLFGKTGGFLIGFLFLSLLCGLSLHVKNKLLRSLIILSGLLLDHLAGVLQFAILTKVSLIQSAVLVSFPYLIKDMLLLAGAYYAALAVRKALQAASIPIDQSINAVK